VEHRYENAALSHRIGVFCKVGSQNMGDNTTGIGNRKAFRDSADLLAMRSDTYSHSLIIK
jgi:hypothetical protein